MKIRIKLDLYILKEYFIVTLWGKNVGEGLSKRSEKVVKMRNQNRKLIPSMTTFSMKDCLVSLAHRTDKCIDFGLGNVVPFLN